MIGRDTCGTYLFRQYHLCYLLKIIKLAVEGSEKNILISKFSHVIVVLPLYVLLLKQGLIFLAQAGLELTLSAQTDFKHLIILQPQPSEFQDYRNMSLCPDKFV